VQVFFFILTLPLSFPFTFTCTAHAHRQVLYDILARPGCTLNLLGAAIPATATYFAQLVVVKALSGLLVELSRPTSLLQVSCCCISYVHAIET